VEAVTAVAAPMMLEADHGGGGAKSGTGRGDVLSQLARRLHLCFPAQQLTSESAA